MSKDNDFIHSAYFRAIIGCGQLLIVYPLCSMKTLGALRFASLLSILTIGYTIIVVIIEFPMYLNKNWDTAFDPKAFRIGWQFFDACGITLTSYGCQNSIFEVFGELQRSSKNRINKVVQRSVGTMCLFYLLMSISGYFLHHSFIKVNIL